MLGVGSTSKWMFGTEFRGVYPNVVTLAQYFKNEKCHLESMGKVFLIGHGNINDDASWSILHHKEKVIEYILPESTNYELTSEEVFFENTRKYVKGTPKNKGLPRGETLGNQDVLDEAYVH